MGSGRPQAPADLSQVAVGTQRLGVGVVSLIATLREAARLPVATIQWLLGAQYHRLAARRGARRAALAVAHSLLVICYFILRDGRTYEDLGGTYFDERNKEAVQRRLVRRLEALGNKVHLEPAA